MALGPNYRRLFAASTISNLGDGVGIVAYPWLASAVTRNPLLIALVTVGRFLPWLLFSLPAGVITDRFDRRRIMIAANVGRAVLTAGVALAVIWRGAGLPSPDELAGGGVVDEDIVLYVAVLLATVLLGMAEVLYDNSAQTFMPRVVAVDQLERANGRLYSAEMVANTFVGPPLGSFLLIVGFALPFVVDAGTFAASAGLIALITIRTPPRAAGEAAPTREPWRQELREGFGWLWRHDLLRTMAIVLGVMNGLTNAAFAVFILFSQEVLGTTPTQFAVLTAAGAVGGVIGGWSAAAISRRIGSGPSLAVTLIGCGIIPLGIGLTSSWPVAAVLFAVEALLAVLWNVITVSLRQTIIPDHLLGRVNSVYRFFAWGMIPIGAAFGGLTVAVVQTFATREVALRVPWILAGLGHLVLYVYARSRLTTAKMDAARAAADVPGPGAMPPVTPAEPGVVEDSSR